MLQPDARNDDEFLPDPENILSKCRPIGRIKFKLLRVLSYYIGIKIASCIAFAIIETVGLALIIAHTCRKGTFPFINL